MTQFWSQRGWLALMLAVVATLAVAGLPSTSYAQEEGDTAAESADAGEPEEAAEEPAAELGVEYALDTAMLFLSGVLVFFMQAGFAMVEAGFNSSKNAVNILFKNSMDICVGVLLFYFVGFGLMYPGNYGVDTVEHSTFAFGGVGLDGYEAAADRGYSVESDWFFQAMFAATAATIVSGAVAGRMKVSGYLIYSAVLTGLIYPISGFWKWGSGWLTQFGEKAADGSFPLTFQDFAGSAVVHAVGGFAGLAGAIVLGPRIGRYVNGKSVPMPGHSLPIAALGVFILWFGWYGFNPGSQLAFSTEGDIDAVSHIAVTTTLAAGAGGLCATLLSWVLFGKPDLSMGLNGILAGLVGITACCDCMTNDMSVLVGAIAGVIVVCGIMLLDKLKIDDPVGAFPVHGLCGMWGCLAIGILPNGHTSAAVAEKLYGTPTDEFAASTNLGIQLTGTLSIAAWAFVTMLVLFFAMKAMGILRVSAAEEQQGLDISEHGMQAYGGSPA